MSASLDYVFHSELEFIYISMLNSTIVQYYFVGAKISVILLELVNTLS